MLIFSHVNMKIKFQINQLKEVSVNVKEKIKTNIVLISGEMGVGKTTLIKEVLLSMKVIENVSSPTFSIINEYITGQNKIVYHMDLYRIKNISEIEGIGLFEYLESVYQLPGAGVFQYISFRAALAVITSLLVSMVFGGKIINLIRKGIKMNQMQ